MSFSYVTCPDVSWRLPPGILTLGCDEVHVWRASLEVTPLALKTISIENMVDRTEKMLIEVIGK